MFSTIIQYLKQSSSAARTMEDTNNNCDADIPLPRGCRDSRILDEQMAKQILEVLPARAKENDWVRIYNAQSDGFSLATLYRKMESCGVSTTPVLLVVRDRDGNVFGAVASSKLYCSSSYYGTGDATFLLRFAAIGDEGEEAGESRFDAAAVRTRLEIFAWTGTNEFFIHANADFLGIGGGDGRYGLWLEATLERGFSQRCATFDNPPLAGDKRGDDDSFEIVDVEAFGFTVLI